MKRCHYCEQVIIQDGPTIGQRIAELEAELKDLKDSFIVAENLALRKDAARYHHTRREGLERENRRREYVERDMTEAEYDKCVDEAIAGRAALDAVMGEHDDDRR